MTSLLSLSLNEAIFATILMVLCIFLWTYVRKPCNLPPGPNGLPIVGYLPFIKDDVHIQFNKLAEEYGEIFSISVGQKLLVVLNSYEIIKEALVCENFAGRPVAHKRKGETLSFMNSEGETFRDHKRFAVRTLKEFGVGKCSLEASLKEEVRYLLDEIKSVAGVPTDIGGLIKMSVSNVICALLHGKRFDYKDEHFQTLVSLVGEHLSRIHPILYPVYASLVKKIPGFRYLIGKLHQDLVELDIKLFNEMKKKVKQRAETHQYGTRNDFIGAWLTEAEERKESDTKFSIDYLARSVQALIVAGTDTTANSLRWGLLYLMSHPDVQAKVQNEIDEIIGRERMPSFSDQDHMPYTSAVLKEIQRTATLLPFGVFHSNFEETKLKNFTIPKRSIIIPNLWAVHHNPNTYPEPEKFQPERFIDTKENICKEEKLIPFSIGKRQCLGESLARMELFIYFTSMFQQFKFQIPCGETLSFDYKMALVAVPKPFKIIAIER